MRASGTVSAAARTESVDCPSWRNQTGCDRYDADPVGRQIECERACQRFAAALRGVVGGHAAVGAGRAAARHVDDHAAALRGHQRCRAAGAEELPFQVDADDLVPPRFVALEEVTNGAAGDRSVVHEYVEPLPARDDLVEAAVDVGRRADVGAQRDHLNAVPELTRCALDRGVDVDESDLGTVPRQTLGNRTTNVARRSGDECDLAKKAGCQPSPSASLLPRRAAGASSGDRSYCPRAAAERIGLPTERITTPSSR
jgi:hypothetical protein